MPAVDDLELLAGTGDAELAPALAARGWMDRDGLAAVVDATAAWAWESAVEAGRFAERCRVLAAGEGWDEVVAASAYVEARAAMAAGRVADARGLLLVARRGFEQHGDADGVARTALGVAAIEAAAGRLDVARDELTPLTAPGSGVDDLLVARASQNLANVEIMSGRFEVGLDLLARAEAVFAAHDLRREVVDVVNNRAVALLGTGRVTDAIAAADEALARLHADEDADPRAELLDTSARAHLLAGDFATALARFQSSLEITRLHRADDRSAATLLGLADVWATLNLHVDAAHDYEAVADWAEANGAMATLAWARLGQGIALGALGRHDEGRDLVAAALDAFDGAGQAAGVTAAALGLAAMSSEPAQRSLLLDRAAASAHPSDRPVDAVFVELARYDHDGAAVHLDAADAVAASMSVPRVRYEIDLRRGRHRRAEGRLDDAVDHLRRAADVIERTRGTLVTERHRRGYLADRLAAHVELVAVLLQRGGAGDQREAFDVAERSRSRALLDAMAGLAARPPAGATSEAIARFERFGRDLEALYNRSLGDDELRSGVTPRCDLATMEARIENLRSSGAGALHQVAVVSLDDLQRRLHVAQAALVSYHVDLDRGGRGRDDARVVAFVVDADRLTVRVLPVGVGELADAVRRLDAQVARFRAGQAFTDRWSAWLEAATTSILAELGAALVDPLADLIGGTERLVIVPDNQLGGIPFAALGTGRGRVIDHHDVAVAPSASAWVHCVGTAAATGSPMVLAVADARAPRVDVEAERVAAVLDGAQVFQGPAATRAALLHAHRPSVAHLACHGVFHPEHAMFSALRLADGWTTAYELADLDLHGALVVLSACESGRMAVQPGGELMGLPRAMLLAGARDVVTSGWLAHDGATAALMERFYAHLADDHDPSAALRRAQLELERSHPHPFFWAGFTVMGAGWRSVPVARAAHDPATRPHAATRLESIA